MADNKEKLLNAKRIIIVACGTSWHAGLIGKYLIENFCRIPVTVEYASEFRYSNPVVTENDVVIAISQSGETADTLAAIEVAKRNGAFVYGICNVVGSSIPRATDAGSYIHVGPEIGVASTKAFTGQVTVLAMFALALAKEKDIIDKRQYSEIIKELWTLPEKMKTVLELNNRIAELSRIFTYAHNFLYLGRGYSYPVALEGALNFGMGLLLGAKGYWPQNKQIYKGIINKIIGTVKFMGSNIKTIIERTYLKTIFISPITFILDRIKERLF